MAKQLTNTFGNLKTRVRRWLNEPTASESFWTDNFLQETINSNYRLRCAEIHMAAEGAFISVQQRDITANQYRYAWPSNFQRLNKLEIVRTDGARQTLRRFERQEGGLVAPGTGTGADGYTPTYRPTGSGFDLEPGPVTTVTNGLRLEYISVPAELESDTDSLHADFPGIFSELIVLDSAISCFNTESIVDAGQGLMRTVELERRRWEERWDRYIESRLVSRQAIEPFGGPYRDA